jgi:hypothetical protein
MAEDADDGQDWSNYDSGPFCRHWFETYDCEIKCANCGHVCTRHKYEDGRRECLEDDCHCEAWVEPE